MKLYLLLIVTLGCLNLNSQANLVKSVPENHQELKVLSLQKSNFEDPDIKYIDIGYFDQKASYVKIYSRNVISLDGRKEDSKYFDLNFDGDVYILKQNYPTISLPSPLNITSQNIHGQKNDDFYDIRRISIYPDSTLYYYSINSFFEKEKTMWGIPAKYKGDIISIQNEISEMMKQNTSIHRSDSIAVFEITITKKGVIKSGVLIGGKSSVFSKYVYETLVKNKNAYFSDGTPKWKPAIIYSSGRPIETKLKVYAKLDKNNTVTIKLPNTLRNFTGN